MTNEEQVQEQIIAPLTREALKQAAQVSHTLIDKALQGEISAIRRVLQHLQSPNYDLRQIIQGKLHQSSNPNLWGFLLGCMATGAWVNALDEEAIQAGDLPPIRMQNPESAFQTLAETFVVDTSQDEKKTKQEVLQKCLNYPTHADEGLRCCQYAAAYVSALRGDQRAIPFLDEVIQQGDKTWQLRAIQALAALHSHQCAPPLLKALANPDQKIHQEASKALNEMGELAREVWMDALHHPNSHIRWHGARGLGQIGDPQALETLAIGLTDENQAVRWATARVLANLDSTAIPAILFVLSHYPLSEPFRQASYHALHAMPSQKTQEYLQPLLQALRSPAADLEAPRVAQRMALEWKNASHKKSVK